MTNLIIGLSLIGVGLFLWLTGRFLKKVSAPVCPRCGRETPEFYFSHEDNCCMICMLQRKTSQANEPK